MNKGMYNDVNVYYEILCASIIIPNEIIEKILKYLGFKAIDKKVIGPELRICNSNDSLNNFSFLRKELLLTQELENKLSEVNIHSLIMNQCLFNDFRNETNPYEDKILTNTHIFNHCMIKYIDPKYIDKANSVCIYGSDLHKLDEIFDKVSKITKCSYNYLYTTKVSYSTYDVIMFKIESMNEYKRKELMKNIVVHLDKEYYLVYVRKFNSVYYTFC
jgi:hypothetical protein